MSERPHANFGDAFDAALRTQHRTARALAKDIGIDESQVSRWRRGHGRPSNEQLEQVEGALGVDLSAFYDGGLPEYELYVSAPITGLQEGDLPAHRDAVAQVVEAVEPLVNGAYWPGRDVSSVHDLRAPNLATGDNLQILLKCRALLYLQFAELHGPSSALVELGMALGHNLRTTIIVGPGLRTPFMLKGFDAVAARLKGLPDAQSHTETPVGAAQLITVNKRPLLGL